MNEPITVVGAGFSGLTTAYFLTKQRFKVRIVENSDRPGGLIHTIRTEHGLVETAANGLLASARLEAMCADIGVPLVMTRREGRRRFIYRGKPKQVPLTLGDMLSLSGRVALNLTKFSPRPFESIGDWSRRVLGQGATDYLLTPALGGIYAGDPDRLSASLIFGKAKLPDHLNTTKPAKGRLHGTVAPPNGMQQLIDGLVDYLQRNGAEFALKHEDEPDANRQTILCLSANAASKYLEDLAPDLAQALSRIEMLSLATVTCFYSQDAAKLQGFGCLFPRSEGFRARGALFNDFIFEGRGPAHAETWIFGGALDPDVVTLSDDELARTIAAERERFYGRRDQLLELRVTRWRNVLPHYSIELERILTMLPPPPKNIALVGNYLGRIGLAKILERAAFAAEQMVRTPPASQATSATLNRVPK
ncbi:MAG TPA: FAD-dependent oxidoreductase [Pyrinomonadaceae bacterium]|jgi:oxygen-dependent protoporphyrinogen oxidase|nr:FAD-dependent oxidoreductase [Pyrinomonadaceae bacterium]